MILQCGKPVNVWGTAMPGEKIIVSIQGKTIEVTVDENGTWKGILPELAVSESEILTVQSDQEKITLNDVAVGEVWIAGGQSNMEFPMRFEMHWKDVKSTENAENLNLRFYDVPEICYDGQDEDFDYSAVGIWRKATPDDLEYFSAVGYYFQRELESTLHVPVGIVGCNWGGTYSCAWISEETIQKVGPEWIQLYEHDTAELDVDKYWEEQHSNPWNDRGNPNTDLFSTFIMPRTPDQKEFQEFIENSTLDFEAMNKNIPPQRKPGCLYEHMVKTIAPYTVRGVLWYQGESDDVPELQKLYQKMLTGLIQDWRKLWGELELPFLLVQLPGWRSWLGTPNFDYTTIRRCQELTVKDVNDTYLCSISDAGEEFDIHPKNKLIVGHRLALLARKYIYGEEILSDAPVIDSVVRNDRNIVLDFKNASDSLCLTKSSSSMIEALELAWFSSEDVIVSERVSVLDSVDQDNFSVLNIEDENGIVPFTARVKDSQLVIELETDPKGRVRIAFAQDAWYLVNLYNHVGIPAIPFDIYC